MEAWKKLWEMFQNPPSNYRSAPFWSWNDKLNAQELQRQIHEMKQQGMGGFFMHSREGLETVYMSQEWMSCVHAAVEEAKALEMHAWIYDEDRWPSGAAGGLVPKMGDAYRSKGITVEQVSDRYHWEPETVCVFSAEIHGTSIVSAQQLAKAEQVEAAEGQVLLVFRLEISQPSEWFNDDAPSDNLNPDCVKAFLDTTYEAYHREFGEDFGKTIPGIFTDEPNISHRYCKFSGNRGFIPWTFGFEEYFRSANGYDLIPLLPQVFLDGPRSSKVRHDYWRTISNRFVQSYTQQLYHWCQDKNLSLTGHFLFENELGAAVKVGGAVMPHYQFQQLPGIDMLDEQTDEDLTVRQCTSVAHQFGRRRVLTETYAATGWEFDFEGQKWLGDWQFVQGINLRCQHVGYYSIRGCRKRDFPPAFSYNTSWWKYHHVVENYFARLSVMLTQGEIVRNVLVLHPLSTAWSMMGSDLVNPGMWQWDSYAQKVNRYGETFNALLRLLMGEHFDFDLGDETILAQCAAIQDGQMQVNHQRYTVVVLPRITTMLRSTWELLQKFLQNGGHVIALRPLPTQVEGEDNAPLAELVQYNGFIPVDGEAELVQELSKFAHRAIRIRDAYGFEQRQIFSMARTSAAFDLFFLSNNDRERGYEADIELPYEHVQLWNPLTGQITHCQRSNGKLHLQFLPNDSKLLLAPKSESFPLNSCPVEEKNVPQRLLASLGPVCAFQRTVENTLVLDQCRYRFAGSRWSEEMDVWRAQAAIREALGMRQVYYNGLPQRYKWANEPHPGNGTPIALDFRFFVQQIPNSKVYLLLEGAANFQISCNGEPVAAVPDGWFLDRALQKIALPSIKEGENHLSLTCAYHNSMELEDVYLAGDFAVDVQRKICREPETLHFGDWTLQGYYHYCGSIVYQFPFVYQGESGVTLALGDYQAVHVEVRVNGSPAGQIPWKSANGVVIDQYLQEGENLIELEVMGSPRNLFGPFHQAQGKVMRTDWRAFRTEGSDYTPDYILKPYGLFGQVHITCREE